MKSTKDFAANVDRFIERAESSNDHRYRSFDFCYNYFRSNINNVAGDRLEKSCMQLWAYLASWGMLRGSSALLNLNPRCLVPLVEYINLVDHSFWNIDVDSYNGNQAVIVDVYNKIEGIISGMHVSPTITLVTKIMLGVFGNVPAFDQYFNRSFCEWLRANGKRPHKKFDDHMVDLLSQFYDAHRCVIDSCHSIHVIDFDGNETPYSYPKAKLIDMWGFTKYAN